MIEATLCSPTVAAKAMLLTGIERRLVSIRSAAWLVAFPLMFAGCL